MQFRYLMLSLLFLLISCGPNKEAVMSAQTYIDEYTATLLDLYYASARAEWASNTRIVEGDTTNAGGWYRRAGKPASSTPLNEEWDEIAAALLR